MRLTKQTGHAIRILLDCALAGDQLVKVAGISSRLGVTKQNVFKIVHILSRAGFVVAVRGPNGGVRLARPATEICIGDIVRSIEVTRVLVEGGRNRKSPESDPVNINAMFDDALSAFISVLDQHSLAELAVRSPVDIANMTGTEPASATRTSRARASTKKPAARSMRRS